MSDQEPVGPPAAQVKATQNLRYERVGHVGLITLDRQDKLNALSPGLMRALSDTLSQVDADRDVHVLVLTGAGDRAFSVGFDLDGLVMASRTNELIDVHRRNVETLLQIWRLRVPVIAAVNGYAIAAGSNLALIADVTVASESAKFGEPEIRHFALSPLLLQPWFTANRKWMHYLYYTGDTISAQEALELGMVARVVPAGRLLPEAMEMARRIALAPPFAVEMVKESLRRAYDSMGFTNAMYQHMALDMLMLNASGIPERDRFFELMKGGDMRAFLESRDGPFRQPG